MKPEREIVGRPFKSGHKNTHDVATAGRKGKQNSPWRKGLVSTPAAMRQREKWNNEGSLRK